MRRSGVNGMPTTSWVRPVPAPLKAKIWLKPVDPAMIMSIIIVISMVAEKDFLIKSQFRFLYKAARIKVPITPIAADSEGVAIPKKINPTTRKKINPNGNIYRTEAFSFSDKGVWATS